MPQAFWALYQRIILDHPWRAILATVAITVAMALGLPNFKLDASADSLTLEYDEDLNFFREVSQRYGSDNFLIITFSPKSGDLFDKPNLETLGSISEQLKTINEKVTKVLEKTVSDTRFVVEDEIHVMIWVYF